MKTKEEYIDSLAAELKVWSAEIDNLHAKAEAASEDVKIKYHAEIEALRVKECEANEKIKELQATSGEAWDTVKVTAEQVWQDLRTGLSTIVDKFK
jgi:hypothetical protein